MYLCGVKLNYSFKTSIMETVKFLVIADVKDGEQNTTIICQDGGVAAPYNNGSHMIVDLYRERITPETDLDTIWENLGKGKMHCADYPLLQKVTPTIIKESMTWLMTSTEEYLSIVEFHTLDSLKVSEMDKVSEWIKLNYKAYN